MARCKMTARRGALLSTYTKQTISSNNVPSSTTLTYEGLFSESYFKINKKEKNYINNIEISSAHIINPLTNEKETWIYYKQNQNMMEKEYVNQLIFVY